MGKKTPPPQPHTYRSIPLLAKPGKRSRQEALPSALHMGVCVTLCLLVFAIINICVTELLGRRNPYTKLVQSGTLMAMITTTVLATPNLGNSFTKAFQRIVGAMLGGWLFFGLYAACQQWWFLVICLAVWGFVLVALSFFLSGREFLFPVALVTAFIVACNFNSVKQAMVMTLVKTVAFSGAIVVYTFLSLIVFPLTATQQLMSHMAMALNNLQQLADIVLVVGEHPTKAGVDVTAADPPAAGGCKDIEAQPAAGAAALADGVQTSSTATSANTDRKKKLTAAQASLAVNLATEANNHLQLVQQLLPMTYKERYIGTFGSYRCFLPTVSLLKSGRLPEQEVLAVVVNASQVLRVLTTMLSEFGALPLAQRPPPRKLTGKVADLVAPLAQQSVAALQDIAAGLPVSGPCSHPVPIGNIQAFSSTLQQLVAATLQYDDTPTAPAVAPPTSDQTGAASAAEQHGDTGPDTAAGRWQKAAVATTGIKLPAQQPHEIAFAFSQLLTASVSSEEGQVARWCSVLVMSRELGRAIAGLNDSVNQMLPRLPWLAAGAKL